MVQESATCKDDKTKAKTPTTTLPHSTAQESNDPSPNALQACPESTSPHPHHE